MTRPRIILAIYLFAAQVVSPGALGVGRDLVRVKLDELSGRFSVWVKPDASRVGYLPLLFEDARTSFPTLWLDGRHLRLGDVPEFRFTIAGKRDGATVRFRGGTVTVEQTVLLKRSGRTGWHDSFEMSFAIRNAGPEEVRAGLRMTLDTWLGEAGGNHFELAGIPRVGGEMAFRGEELPEYILSSGSTVGLRIEFDTGEAAAPETIVLANWKKLADSPWHVSAGQIRGFSLAPFSIQDSAVSLYWNPAMLAPGETRVCSFRLVAVQGNPSVPGASAHIQPPGRTPVVASAITGSDAVPASPGTTEEDDSGKAGGVETSLRATGGVDPDSLSGESIKANAPVGPESSRMDGVEETRLSPAGETPQDDTGLLYLWGLLDTIDDMLASPETVDPETLLTLLETLDRIERLYTQE